MKTLLLALSFIVMMGFDHAEETMGEKAKDTMKDAKRSVKKGAHRVEEAVCAKSDAKCLAEKAKHRASEGGDAVSDKAEELKNNVD